VINWQKNAEPFKTDKRTALNHTVRFYGGPLGVTQRPLVACLFLMNAPQYLCSMSVIRAEKADRVEAGRGSRFCNECGGRIIELSEL
jgi:hypothetical protein